MKTSYSAAYNNKDVVFEKKKNLSSNIDKL